ncbi:hypothetical protein BDV12DRAFT_207081, partial [Aspergillus spectabilis]
MSSSYSGSILITGGTAGLGYHCSLALARKYPTHLIIIASRTPGTPSAASAINKSLNQKNVQYIPLDLTSIAQIRLFVQSWSQSNNPMISHLILNAGLQFPGELDYTEDGFEQTFAVNHIGHALLFSLLTPYLAEDTRIVLTASGTHDPAQKTGVPNAVYTTAEELAHPSSKTMNNPGRQRYLSSKLVTVLWTYALEKRLAELRRGGKKWTVVAFDPGLVPGTGLLRDASSIERFLWTRVLPKVLPVLRALMSPNIHTAEESGASLAWLAIASDAKVKESTGRYYEGRKEIKSSVDSYDEGKQEDLWWWTVKNLAKSKEEEERFELKGL